VKHGAPVAAALAAAMALPSLRNEFVYDDALVVLQNPLVHGLAHSRELWQSSYWPAGLLYRPATTQLFALEWTLGGGSPVLFHAVGILLAALTALLVFRLCRRLLPEPAAVLAAVLFALHPVHVEVVAGVVGQAELLAALCALLAVERFLAWSAEGEIAPGRRLLLAGLTLLGILAKETGYVIPLLLAAAHLTAVRQRRERPGNVYILQAAAVAAGLLLRIMVLGSFAGESPATMLRGLNVGSRAVAMLAVVPEWVRLLLWPAHLQAEYGPPALPVSSLPGAAHIAGLALLIALLLLLLRSWRRQPVLAFGLLWMLLALAPVSNVLAPTGILLAERVLFLPSVGLVIALGVGIAALLPAWRTAPPAARLATVGTGLALLALAGWKAVIRQAAWRSQDAFFAQLQQDAPRTYRAQFVASRYYYGEQRFAEAELAARRALALYPLDPQVHEQLGQVLRVQGRCAEALPILSEGVRLSPEGTTVRSRLIECALAVGDTARARAAATEAVRLGQPEFQHTLDRLDRRRP